MTYFNSPVDTGMALCKLGIKKGTDSTVNLIVLGILAGVYIGFGAQLTTLITADLENYVGFGFARFLSGSVFSIGLMLVILAGAELFTGNSLIVIGYLNGDVNGLQLLRNWFIVYFANFAGALLLVYFMYMSGLWKIASGAIGAKAVLIADGKTSLSFAEALIRGILANWLVCLAVWLAICSKTITGKILSIYFPIMTFVASGFEHSIANMYFIPMGIYLKGQDAVQGLLTNTTINNLTWSSFIYNNLIPVTIGNIIGGAFSVGFVYWYIYIRPLKASIPRKKFQPIAQDKIKSSM